MPKAGDMSWSEIRKFAGDTYRIGMSRKELEKALRAENRVNPRRNPSYMEEDTEAILAVPPIMEEDDMFDMEEADTASLFGPPPPRKKRKKLSRREAAVAAPIPPPIMDEEDTAPLFGLFGGGRSNPRKRLSRKRRNPRNFGAEFLFI